MEIAITGRNLDLDASIKNYVHKKLDKLGHMYRRIYKCTVILEGENARKTAEIILYLKRNQIIGKETSPDIYASIDIASDRVKKQIVRLSGRLSSRRRKNVFKRLISPLTGFRRYGGLVTDETPDEIFKSNAFAEKPMIAEEAKLELELMKRAFIVFKNADTGEVNVLYKRNDGNYGLIEPKF